MDELQSVERRSVVSFSRKVQDPGSEAWISSALEAFTSPECSHDRQWIHYVMRCRVAQLSPSEYKIALAIRCAVINDFLKLGLGGQVGFRCDCGNFVMIESQPTSLIEYEKEKNNSNNNQNQYESDEELDNDEKNIVDDANNNNNRIPIRYQSLAEHLLHCKKVAAINFTHRHTAVKDALRFVLARYGIRCHNEPHFYSSELIPDLTMRIQGRQIATDVTVVLPKEGGMVGEAAENAAQEKKRKYDSVVTQFGHEFIPFAVETTGHFGTDCMILVNKLQYHVDFEVRYQFRRDVMGAVSTALAKYRANSVSNAIFRVTKKAMSVK